MGLTMSQRHAVTKTISVRYTRADKTGKGVILAELRRQRRTDVARRQSVVAQGCGPGCSGAQPP